MCFSVIINKDLFILLIYLGHNNSQHQSPIFGALQLESKKLDNISASWTCTTSTVW